MVEIAPQTHMGAVELSVSDLDRSLDYWQRVVGLRVLDRDDAGLRRSARTPSSFASSRSPARSPPTGTPGLYHVALLVPDRPSLARWLAHAARDQIRTRRSLRPRRERGDLPARSRPARHRDLRRPARASSGRDRSGERMTTLPLDVENLLAELDDPATEPFDGLPDGTTVGHVHLRVADVDSTVAFYRDVLGMDLMAQLGAAAAFLSAGGYHHHVGGNTWESRGAAPARPPASRRCGSRRSSCRMRPSATGWLRGWRIPGRSRSRAGDGVLVRDPSGNPLLLTG